MSIPNKHFCPFFIIMDTAQSFILKLAATELEKELFHPMKVLLNGTKHISPHTLSCQGSGSSSTIGAITKRP